MTATPVTATPAPAARALLAEATALFPRRSRASDGIMSSDAHRLQNPRSGHDYGNAVDLTHDPAAGCDAHGLAAMVMVRRDPRVLYVISRRRIWSRARYGEGWRAYTGANPHDAHAHIELDPARRDDVSPWWPGSTPPPQITTVATWEDDVPLTTLDVPVATTPAGQPNAGSGWATVPYLRDRIVGFTAPGLRPAEDADARYETAEVGFAADADATVVSVVGWAPGAVAHVRITVVE